MFILRLLMCFATGSHLNQWGRYVRHFTMTDSYFERNQVRMVAGSVGDCAALLPSIRHDGYASPSLRMFLWRQPVVHMLRLWVWR
jgi:hypothetical protein